MYTAAAASTPACQTCSSASERGMADPAMAPIAAGPAPDRNACDPRVGPYPVEIAGAEQDETERRRERHQRGQQPATHLGHRVADYSYGLDDRSRRDLAKGDCVQELGVGHPVVVVDGVVCISGMITNPPP